MLNSHDHSEGSIQRLIDAFSDIVYFQSLDGEFTLFNDASIELIGYPPDLCSKPDFWPKIIHPEDAPKIHHFFAHQSGLVDRFQLSYRVKHKDGHWVWLESNIIASRENGKINGYHGTARDISSRKKEVEILQSQSEKLRFLTGSATKLLNVRTETALFDYVADKCHELVNGKGLITISQYNHDFTEWSVFKLKGSKTQIREIAPHLLRKGRVGDAVRQMLSTGKLIQDQFKILEPELQSVLTDAGVVSMKTINLIRANQVYGNITFLGKKPLKLDAGITETFMSQVCLALERIHSERKSAEHRNQLSNIIESIPGAVYRIEMETEHVDFMSEPILEITEYPATSFTDDQVRYAALVHEDDKSSRDAVLENAAGKGARYEVTYRLYTRSGIEKWIWEKGGFITYGGQKFREGVLMDISDRIQQEDRIIAASLQAEDSERRRISSAIHDGVQQTLVSSLMAFQNMDKHLQPIASENLITDFREAIKVLQKGVHETQEIAHRIMPKSLQDFGLVKTLESMIATMNEAQAGIRFIENLKGKRMDPKIETTVYRIVREALNNAHQYANAQETTVQLMYLGNRVQLTIEDDGKGFDPENEDFLFRGLGISFMKNRTHAIGGTFEINSRPGVGTSIMMEAPAQLF